MHPASIWLNNHWSSDDLPNNMWIAASPEGIIVRNASLDNGEWIMNYELRPDVIGM